MDVYHCQWFSSVEKICENIGNHLHFQDYVVASYIFQIFLQTVLFHTTKNHYYSIVKPSVNRNERLIHSHHQIALQDYSWFPVLSTLTDDSRLKIGKLADK